MIFLGVALALVFLFEYLAPHRFAWEATFDKNDKEPFGSYVFDDVVSSSVDNYTVTNRTFYQLMQEESTARRQAFLLTENYFNFNETDIEYLYELIHAGNQVMICTDNFPSTLEDTLCFETDYDRHFLSIDRYIREGRERDSLFFGKDTLHPEYIYEVYPQMHPVYLTEGMNKWKYDRPDNDSTEHAALSTRNETIPIRDETACDRMPASSSSEEAEEDTSTFAANQEMSALSDSLILAIGDTDEESTGGRLEYQFFPMNCDSMEILVWNRKNKPLVIRAFIGKGELFLVSTPLMFTNYSVLDGDNASYAFRLLSYMKDRPLTRIEAYGNHSEKARTPLRYVLSEPPLRWATCSLLALLILFMAFAAKRRQRIIPVVRTPANRTLEFMQLVSNLYYQKHENGEILKMKHLYFCAEVQRLIGMDLQQRIPDDTTYLRLSEKTGMDRDLLRTLIKNIGMGLYRSDVSDMQLKEYIDGMNTILYTLKS
jgi:hypothetical protein